MSRVKRISGNLNKLKYGLACVALSMTCLAFGLPGANAQTFGERCDALNGFDMTIPQGEDVDFVGLPEAVFVDASGDTPAYCAVTFKIDIDADDPEDWFITSTYFLPDVNAPLRFVHTGGGGNDSGWDGQVDGTLLREGIPHAEMNNDSQERGVRWLNADLNNEAARAFSRDGIHLSTVVGKQLLEAFYDDAPVYSYYIGCSTGGNQGLQVALYHPDTFDGVVAGDPVFYVAETAFWALWQKQLAQDLLTAPPFGPTKNTALAAAVTEYCDPQDGVDDGVVDRPEQCKPPIYDMADQVGFTEEEKEILREYLKAHDLVGKSEFLNGHPVRVPLPAHSVVNPWIGTAWEANIFAGAWYGTLDTSYPPEDLGTDAWIDALLAYDFDSRTYRDRMASYATSCLGGQYQRNVAAVGAAGGKLLVWHNWQDSIANVNNALDWLKYQQHLPKNKLGDRSQDYFRFLTKTTGGHCGGDSGLLREAIFDWVELGESPDALALDPGSNRLSCSYPKVPKLVDPETDEWQCVQPEPYKHRRRTQGHARGRNHKNH